MIEVPMTAVLLFSCMIVLTSILGSTLGLTLGLTFASLRHAARAAAAPAALRCRRKLETAPAMLRMPVLSAPGRASAAAPRSAPPRDPAPARSSNRHRQI